jgi:hypothetical protein
MIPERLADRQGGDESMMLRTISWRVPLGTHNDHEFMGLVGFERRPIEV